MDRGVGVGMYGGQAKGLIDMRGTKKGNKVHIARPDYTEGLEGGKIHAPARNGRTRFEWLEAAVRSAEKKQDIERQHGPVKVLWKDGKPVQ